MQDLGRLRQGVHTPCYFQLTNTSSQTVYISRIIGSCSCTSHAITETKLAPGAATKLRLEHDSGSSRGAASASISVLYFLEGEDRLRKLVVGVQAEVDPDVAVSLDRLEFSPEVADTKSVELRANQISALDVKEVACTHRAFSAILEPPGADAAAQRVVRVAFDPAQWQDSSHTAELFIKTNSVAEPVLRIGLSVTPPQQEAKP